MPPKAQALNLSSSLLQYKRANKLNASPPSRAGSKKSGNISASFHAATPPNNPDKRILSQWPLVITMVPSISTTAAGNTVKFSHIPSPIADAHSVNRNRAAKHNLRLRVI